ncbi:MAG: LysM domain-containing protein, partial [Caldimonas sp.]
MPLLPASRAHLLGAATLVAAALALTGCANRPNRAPVEDRTATPRATVAAATPAALPASAPEAAAAVADTAPRPGYYVVKPGDTLIRIGLDNGQNWRDIVRWNNLENPNLIEVGQSLRIVQPGIDPAAATSRPVAAAKVETRALDARAAASTPASATSSPANVAAPPAVAATPPPAAGSTSATREGDDITWSWPVATAVSIPFDEARNKGLVFRG